MPTDPCQNQLAAAVAAMARGDMDMAEATFREILVLRPEHPVAIYLSGRIAMERGDWSKAETLFRHALALAPDRPEIALHLAQSLRALQRAPEALPYCRQVLERIPDHSGAWLELAKAQEESGATDDAQATYRKILAAQADITALVNLSSLLSRTGRAEEAEQMLRLALEDPLWNADARARIDDQLALALKRQRKYEQALGFVRPPMPGTDAPRENLLDHADLLRHAGRTQEAAALYEKRLGQHPLDISVHVLLSEVRRAQGCDPVASFDAALAREPTAPQLPIQKGLLLLKMGQAADAEQAFQTALRIAPRHAGGLQGLGKALEALNDLEGAQAAHAAALAAEPDNGAVLENHVAFLLRRGQARQAMPLAQKAHKLLPNSQAALALLGTCWRALDDGRDDWLNDYQNHVQIFDLEAPAGFKDMERFNIELSSYLDGLHAGAQEYLTQTLRGGTQLHDSIFYNGHTLIDRLLPRINAALQTYIARLQGDADHPFVKRRNRGFRHTGSWSSRLGNNGFHVNHVHNQGWISSCYYVAVPAAVKANAAQQGWIKFGEPSQEYGTGFAPRRTVEPKPGRLVLFPSYMWHGTVPFVAPQPRTTIAFDVNPA
jgi:tetratricopeptide (TPR) repeat protein